MFPNSIILQDKTGVLDGKIWDPNSLGIDEFDALDYIDVMGDVTSFAGAMQVNTSSVCAKPERENMIQQITLSAKTVQTICIVSFAI